MFIFWAYYKSARSIGSFITACTAIITHYYTVVTDPVGNLATNGPVSLWCPCTMNSYHADFHWPEKDVFRKLAGLFFFDNAFYCHNRLHLYGVEMSEEQNQHGVHHLSLASFVSFFPFRSNSNDTVKCRSCLRALEAAQRFGYVLFFYVHCSGCMIGWVCVWVGRQP